MRLHYSPFPICLTFNEMNEFVWILNMVWATTRLGYYYILFEVSAIVLGLAHVHTPHSAWTYTHRQIENEHAELHIVCIELLAIKNSIFININRKKLFKRSGKYAKGQPIWIFYEWRRIQMHCMKCVFYCRYIRYVGYTYHPTILGSTANASGGQRHTHNSTDPWSSTFLFSFWTSV